MCSVALSRVAAAAKAALAAGRRYSDVHATGFRSFRPAGDVRGRALLAHEIEGLLLPADAPAPVGHNNIGEARAMRETLLGLGFAVDVISRERSPLPAAPPLRPLRRSAAELRADRRDAPSRLHQGRASRHRALARQQRRDLRPRARAARPPRGGDRQPQVHPDQPGDRDRRLCDAARQRLRLRQLRLRRQAGVPGAEPLGGHLPLGRGQGLRRGPPAASSGSAARGWCTRASTWCSRPSRGCPTCI